MLDVVHLQIGEFFGARLVRTPERNGFLLGSVPLGLAALELGPVCLCGLLPARGAGALRIVPNRAGRGVGDAATTIGAWENYGC